MNVDYSPSNVFTKGGSEDLETGTIYIVYRDDDPDIEPTYFTQSKHAEQYKNLLTEHGVNSYAIRIESAWLCDCQEGFDGLCREALEEFE